MCQFINKFVLFIINTIFLLLGIAVVGVSLWIIVSRDSLLQLIQLASEDAGVDDSSFKNYMESTSMLMVATYILLIFGIVSLIIGFCGCVGTTCESVPLLLVYSIVITIIVIAEIVGVVTAVMFNTKIGNNLKPRLTRLEQKRFLPWNLAINDTESANAIFTAAVNYAQVSLQCCGIVNMTDITGANTTWTKSLGTFGGKPLKVPVTCCPMNSMKNQLLKKQDWANIENYLANKTCPNNLNEAMTQGCYEKLESTITTYTRPLIAVGIIVVLCEIVCVIMACSMITKIRREREESG